MKYFIISSMFVFLFFRAPHAAAQAVRFSGGTCATQGDWKEKALEQSDTILTALRALKDDPNCKAFEALLNDTSAFQGIMKASDQARAEAQRIDEKYSGILRELQSMNHSLSKRPSKADREAEANMSVSDRKSMDRMKFLLFKKSLDVVTQLQSRQKFYNTSGLDYNVMSSVLEKFTGSAKITADVAVNTTRNILAALPASQECFANRPSEGIAIFTAIVSSGAALATGGEFTQLGPLVSSIMTFNREAKFMKNISAVEYERYKAAVSCLVESTTESYCALTDAQEALNFFRGRGNGSLGSQNVSLDPAQNPMAGMIVLLRDLPTVSSWFQKILLGVDPKIRPEADAKNNNWESIVSFIKQLNSLPASFREQKQNYIDSTSNGADLTTKQAQIYNIVQDLAKIFREGGEGDSLNFFTNAVSSDLLPFYLLGYESFPNGYSPETKGFKTFFSEWSNSGERGLRDPDLLIEKIEQRMFTLMDKANSQASAYFSQKMADDPQNLITEGMVGPNVSPYKSLINIQTYFQHLTAKLEKSKANLEMSGGNENAIVPIEATLGMLADTNERISNILKGMKEVSRLRNASGNVNDSRNSARKSMDVIYEFANMLTSRDSLIGSRAVTAMRMDFTDTLRSSENLSEAQRELLFSMGRDIVTQLSSYFSKDPIVQRLDISQAMAIAEANLKAMEEMFAPTYYTALQELDCKLKGGVACANVRSNFNPVGRGVWGRIWDRITAAPSPGDVYINLSDRPTSDSEALQNLKAKLCVQALAFEKQMPEFRTVCKETVLVSEFSDETDERGLNTKFDDVYANIKKLQASNKKGSKTAARTMGVCALRDYLSKNQVYQMYWTYQGN